MLMCLHTHTPKHAHPHAHPHAHTLLLLLQVLFDDDHVARFGDADEYDESERTAQRTGYAQRIGSVGQSFTAGSGSGSGSGLGAGSGSTDGGGRDRGRRDRRRRRDGDERREEEGHEEGGTVMSRAERMRREKRLDPTVIERCTKCRMAKGICVRRGQDGHLPLRTAGSTDLIGGGDHASSDGERRRHKRSRTEMGGDGGGGDGGSGGDYRQLWRKGTATDSETVSDSEEESGQYVGRSMADSDSGELALYNLYNLYNL
jgi:hypothetical protein